MNNRNPHTGSYTIKYRASRAILTLQRFIRIGGTLCLVAWFGLACLKFGIAYAQGNALSYIAPIANAQTITPSKSIDYPILDKIAQAESHDNQYCTKALVAVSMCKATQIGAPLVRVNTNGSYDIGKYQINSTHLADAIALGYDVYTLQGNTDYAVYLFMTQGSEPWYSSKSNWIK